MKSSDANQSNSMSFPCIILLFSLTLLSLHTTANDNPGKRFISISGKVTGANDQQPLQGVSVTVKGTTTGTATDAEGLYRFNNVDGNATLVFSIVGYQSMELPVKNRTIIDVSLQVEAGQLMETIVTANAIRRDKRSLGYSAPVVRSDELLNGRSTSPLSALQGKVAGVNITSVGGAPNSSTRIVLRGGSSISGNNQALIVIDGVPIDNSDFLGGSDLRTSQNSGVVDPRSTVNFGNRGNDINPEDIESITVLKGPTAAALYGSRASNGAVVITTKSGKKGSKNEVTVSSTVTFSNILKLPKMQNEYGQGYYIGTDTTTGRNIYYNDPRENFSWGPAFDGKTIEWGQEINGKRLTMPYSAAKDNEKKFFELGKGISNTVSFSGSGEKTTFYLSLNSLNNDGIMPGNKDSYNRYNVRFNGTANLSNNISTSVSINYSRINSNLVQGGQGPGSVYDNVLQTPRNIPLDKMGDLNNPYYGYGFLNDRGEPVYGFYAAYTVSPYWLLENYKNQNDVDRVVGNFTVNWKPLKWLNIVERFGADVYSDRRRFKYPKFTYFPWDETTGNYDRSNFHSEVGQYRENTFNVSELVNDLMVTAKKDFGDFTTSLMVGHNLRQRTASLLDASTNESFGLIVPNWYNLDNSNGPLYNYNEYSQRRLMGLYGQLTVGWKELVFLDLTARNDWSSTLPKNNNSFFYPSASASFVFSELLKDGKIGDILNYGKLRASVAQVGNDANPFLLNNYYARAEVDGSFGSTTFPFNGVPGLSRYSRIGNPNLKPEITTAYEVGAEMNLWNNRLYVDFSVYKNRSKDQILTIPIAEASGFTSKVINGGIVENKGVELSLRGTPIRTSSGFSLELYGTYTRNRNKVVDLQQEGVTQVSLGGLADMAAVAAEGKPYGTFYGVDVQHDDQGRVIVDPKTGLPLVTTGAVYFGSYNPKYVASLGANIRYKQWSLNVLFDRKYGGQFVSRTKDIIDFNGTAWETAEHGREPYVFPNSVYRDATGKLVENTSIKMLPQNFFTDQPYGRNVLDASYIKMREVSLSYKLKKSALKKGPFGDVTIGLFGNNLFLWVPSSNKYVDPEINSAGATNLQGFDFTAQPSQRNFGFNISATL
ncbi:SusC/RagA family TonB-linked outer membrane protein [Niastella koreensis]|uniref:TonB-dependent receptor plug n=2 Tax=Niastella koreensis TaxID=354356 RepID=G8T7Z7_NIAKG|nr:SusC/RagA family TonB-linked outer membrane protein [Niastella koreensis]AEV96935.1 TonB-dependent receptor plug [Niastella koreensis GR20-10]OQP39368.1 SusC/RagA family TonB-linked outer membrane protein [Niastella koreensis]